MKRRSGRTLDQASLEKRTLALVPARGGSKGIPRKNVKTLAGFPLIAYTLASAKAAGIERVVLSTEDQEVAAIGERLGFEVPFRRPPELAADDTPTLPVVLHALDHLSESGALEGIDFICLLQPTSPFREQDVIGRCLRFLECRGSKEECPVDSACTVLEVPAEHNPHWVYRVDEHNRLELFTGEQNPIPRRQELPKVVHREGSVYAVRREVLERQHSLYGRKTVGVQVAAETSVNLDTPEDWRRAEALAQTHPELLSLVHELCGRSLRTDHKARHS